MRGKKLDRVGFEAIVELRRQSLRSPYWTHGEDSGSDAGFVYHERTVRSSTSSVRGSQAICLFCPHSHRSTSPTALRSDPFSLWKPDKDDNPKGI